MSETDDIGKAVKKSAKSCQPNKATRKKNSFFLFCDQEKKKVQDQMPSATWNHPKMEETSTKDYFVVSSAFVDNLWDVKVMPCSA